MPEATPAAPAAPPAASPAQPTPTNAATATPPAQPAASLTPERIAEFAARLDKFDETERQLHAERIAHGRTKAQLKIAGGENLAIFTKAFDSFEKTKAALLAQGYSERVIDVLAVADPAALEDLAAAAPTAPATPANGSKPATGIRAEFEAWAKELGLAPAPKGAGREPIVASSGPPNMPATVEQLSQIDTRGMSPGERLAHSKRMESAYAQAGVRIR